MKSRPDERDVCSPLYKVRFDLRSCYTLPAHAIRLLLAFTLESQQDTVSTLSAGAQPNWQFTSGTTANAHMTAILARMLQTRLVHTAAARRH